MAKLYISAGHGGKDPGAVKGNRREKDYNLQIALAIIGLLTAAGHTVYTDRTTDKDSKLADKIKQANGLKVDAVFEIHLNAGGGTGCEVYHSVVGGVGKTLAENICKEISKLGYRNRGARIKKNVLGRDYFAIIRNTKAPANLIECCFIDNDSDMARLNVQSMAQATVKGILTVYPAVIKTPTKPPQKPSQGYKVGDTVRFPGGKHYTSSNSLIASGGNRTAGTAKITNYVPAAKNPFHLVGIKSNVYGWVRTIETAPATSAKKSNEQIAKEVLAGKWGNGADRKKRLTEAGYDYSAIQKIVNKLLK